MSANPIADRARKLILGLLTVALLGVAANAFGCTVCFGDSDHPIVKGLEASVIFLVAVTYSLLGGGVTTAFLLRRRARKLAELQAASAADD